MRPSGQSTPGAGRLRPPDNNTICLARVADGRRHAIMHVHTYSLYARLPAPYSLTMTVDPSRT
jgi:hypothetical protein